MRVRLLIGLFGLLATMACFMAAHAAEPRTTANSDFTIRRWTTDDGLPQNCITALAQTPDGYLWVGTWAGVVRFDGVRFTVFNRYNTPELVNDAINALAIAPNGGLWIGTRDGLISFNDRTWKH